MAVFLLLLPLLATGGVTYSQTGGKSRVMKTLTVQSASFKSNDMIPPEYTCDGTNISPHIKWSGAPEGTKSFALLCDDPDAPVGDWVHWIAYNIPSNVSELPEHFLVKGGQLPGVKGGTNDFGRLEYGGPCPPSGVHRYFFKIFALDAPLSISEGAKKADLLKSMEGHILARGELIGKYTRKR